jgi:hypothetical protein
MFHPMKKLDITAWKNWELWNEQWNQWWVWTHYEGNKGAKKCKCSQFEPYNEKDILRPSIEKHFSNPFEKKYKKPLHMIE